jgi:hypothetical protein
MLCSRVLSVAKVIEVGELSLESLRFEHCVFASRALSQSHGPVRYKVAGYIYVLILRYQKHFLDATRKIFWTPQTERDAGYAPRYK